MKRIYKMDNKIREIVDKYTEIGIDNNHVSNEILDSLKVLRFVYNKCLFHQCSKEVYFCADNYKGMSMELLESYARSVHNLYLIKLKGQNQPESTFDKEEEKTFEFKTDYSNFQFSLGYSYTDFCTKPNLIHLTFMFWYIDVAW